MDAERERLALDTFETLVELSGDARAHQLEALAREDADLAARVRALLAAEAESERLPTDPDRSPARPAPDRIGPYRLHEIIGRGGMGDVYRAVRDDGQFEQTVAIKILGSARAGALARDRFLFERQALARLIHPNIGRLYDGGETADGVLYFVMELITGEDFVANAARHDLSVPDILSRFVDLCGAVQFAHQQLLVHGDIKPGNVLVTPDGTVKLLDFGVARYVAQEAGPPGTSPLTRLYAAPELLGGAPASIASDIFSLGLLLGETLTETMPRRDDMRAPSPSAQLLLAETVTARPVEWRKRRSARICGDLDAIVAKATATAPDERYASAAALAEDLQRHLSLLPVRARSGRAYVVRRFVQRWRWAVTAAATALVLLIAVTIVTSILWIRAESARQLAEQRSDQVRSLARTMMFDVDSAMADVPGSSDARYRLVETARRYLDGLASEREAPHAVQLEAGLGFARIGEILGAPYGANLGRPQEAAAQLERAEAILAPMHSASPGDPEVALALANTLVARGAITVTADGDSAGGLRRIDRACAILDRARSGRRRDAGLAIAKLRCETTRAVATTWDGRYRDAERALIREIAAARGAGGQPHRDRILALARAEYVLGDTLYYSEERLRALAAYRRALVELDRLEGGAVALDLATLARWRIGTTSLELGDSRAALQELTEARRLADLLASYNPDNRIRRMRRLVRLAMARTLSALARHDEAVAIASEDVAERRREAEARPGDAEKLRDYAVAARVLGDLMLTAGRRRDACTPFIAANSAWNALDRRGALAPSDREDEVPAVRRLVESNGCRS